MAEPLLSVRDAEQAAAGLLPPDVRDFVAGGSEAEVTLDANRAALDAVFLTPRVLAGITACDPGTMLVGCRSALPVAVAPMSYQRLIHPEGEIGLARADVLRALSLGAGGVLLGRPALWGLARGGACGAAQVLSLLADELTEAMTLAGCLDVGSARVLQTTALAAELATAGDGGRAR